MEAAAAAAPHYLITNDDRSGNFFDNSLTFYTIEADGRLTLKQQVLIGVTGAQGGYFPANRSWRSTPPAINACSHLTEQPAKSTAWM